MTYSTRSTRGASQSTRDTCWAEGNRGSNACRRCDNGGALEKVAAVGLDGKPNGIRDLLLLAADESVGRGRGKCHKGRDQDVGETHGCLFARVTFGSEGISQGKVL